MNVVFRFDNEAFKRGSTGCPYHDLKVDASFRSVPHLLNLLHGKDLMRAEAAADTLSFLVRHNDITLADYYRLGEILKAGPSLIDETLAEAWQQLKVSYQYGDENKIRLRGKAQEATMSLADQRLSPHGEVLFNRSATDNRPVLIPGTDDKCGFFSLSGLHASGYPLMRTMHSATKASGFTSQVNSLPNHRLEWDAFQSCDYKGWFSAVLNEATAFKENLFIEKSIGVGYSTGALLVISAAATNPELFEGIVLICPPFEVRGIEKKLKLLAASVGDKVSGIIPSVNDYSISLPQPRAKSPKLVRKNPSPKKTPIQPYAAFRDAAKDARDKIHDVRCPILIVSAGSDRLASSESIEKYVEGLNVKHIVIPGASHMLPITDAGKGLGKLISDFALSLPQKEP